MMPASLGTTQPQQENSVGSSPSQTAVQVGDRLVFACPHGFKGMSVWSPEALCTQLVSKCCNTTLKVSQEARLAAFMFPG